MAGTAGFVLGVMNYLRDRPKVNVRIAWDMQEIPRAVHDSHQLISFIEITNVGRRPVYISHVHLMLPDRQMIIIQESVRGSELEEGAKPLAYDITKERKQFPEGFDLSKILAGVMDSTGKLYVSKRKFFLRRFIRGYKYHGLIGIYHVLVRTRQKAKL